jgi:hypothetical protein
MMNRAERRRIKHNRNNLAHAMMEHAERGKVVMLTVEHDDWCAKLKNISAACNCNPTTVRN